MPRAVVELQTSTTTRMAKRSTSGISKEVYTDILKFQSRSKR